MARRGLQTDGFSPNLNVLYQNAGHSVARIAGWLNRFRPFRGEPSGTMRRANRRSVVESCEPRTVMAGDLVISEFMASNDTGIRDEDQNRSDWIEVLNVSSRDINLNGWFLTDSATDRDRWQFPEHVLSPNESVVVFASGKNRSVAGSELHTNFRLSADGEYLALVQPDGQTVEFSFGASYPQQIRDQSFGLAQPTVDGVKLTPAPSGRLLVPSVANGGDQLEKRWTELAFDDSTWTPNVISIGYEKSTGYEQILGTDVASQMHSLNRSAYLRYPFELAHPERVFSMKLSVRYDDGYVAYLNGKEVARKNAPAEVTWNSGATAAHRDRDAIIPEPVTILASDLVGVLRTGANVLAIHALNDDIVSTDFLMIPELTATMIEDVAISPPKYFAAPSPGRPNGLGSTSSILEANHSPTTPLVTEPLVIRATTATTKGPVTGLKVHYRVMFGEEVTVAMVDDGTQGDATRGDGIFAVTLPAGLAQPGQMIRYRISAGADDTDSARLPLYQDPLNSEQYFGTIVADPSIQSNLPVIHFFLEDPLAANVQPGTRGAIYHNGKFYDNVEVDPTGRSVGLSGPKKSHDVQFTSDHWFEFTDENFVMNDFDIISDYWNREKVRVALGYQTLNAVGTPAHLSRLVRTQQNGQFFGTYFFVDGGNEEFLRRAGLNPTGALYKMNLNFSIGLGSYKKQTRTWEDTSDLRAFFAGLDLTGDAKIKFLMDNVDMAAMANYLAGLVIMAHGDCCSKNLYIYRDTEGSGEWEAVPWDVDSAFGRGGIALAQSYFVEAGGIFNGSDNALIKALYDEVPGFRQMYLRRLRTLMDQFVQPPGTPESELYFEKEIDKLKAQLAPDVPADFAKWGSWKTDPVTERITHGQVGVPSWEEEIGLLRNEYMPKRRVFLYNSLKQVNGGKELPAQSGAPEIKFGAVDASPASGNQDEEYIELQNPNALAVDISGWQLTGGIQHTFAPGTVIPAGGKMYVSPNVRAFRARTTGPSGGQGLFVQGNYQGHLSNHGTSVSLMAPGNVLVQKLETTAALAPAQKFLRVSELMFHPEARTTDGRFARDDFEYIELVNTSSTETIDLSHVRITGGVEFQFPDMNLAPNEYIVVANRRDAVAHRYGNQLRFAGQYGNTVDNLSLSNGGEMISIDLGAGDPIQTFTYDDLWYPGADGNGSSLTIVDAASANLNAWSQPSGWRVTAGGTPGSSGVTPSTGDFDGDQRLTLSDIGLFCVGMRANDRRYDLNQDQVVNAADRDQLIDEVFRVPYGDTDLNGTFDSEDLIRIFQAGLYEDTIARNATWAQGDWDCDGDFTTADFVLAMQKGGLRG